LKILLGLHHFQPEYTGGVENRAYRTARELIDRGHDVQVVSVENTQQPASKDLFYKNEIYRGVPVRRLFFDLESAPNKRIWEYDNRWIGKHFLQLLRAETPDLLHLMSGYLITASPLRAAQTLDIPTVVSLTDFWFLCPRITMLRSNGELSSLPIEASRCVRCLREEKRRYRWPGKALPNLSDFYWRLQTEEVSEIEKRLSFLRESLNQADKLISPSKFLRSMYIQAGVDPERIDFSRQGRGFHHLSARELRKHSSDKLRLAYIGQIVEHKGIHVLIKALSIIKSNDIKLNVYGDLNTSEKYAKELIKKAAVDLRIEFCGRFQPDDLPMIHESIDVLIIPSVWYENSPNVILEAFALKTPVIASNLGGMAELIDDGQNGFVFEVGDAEHLAEKIKELINHPERLASLQEGILPLRSQRAEIDDLETIYRNVCVKE